MPQPSSSTSNSDNPARGVIEILPDATPAPPVDRPWEGETLAIDANIVAHEVRRASMRQRLRDAAIVMAWMILFLVVADIAISLVFPIPADPRVEPRNMQAYFNYGRSLEGKLRQMVRDSDDATG